MDKRELIKKIVIVSCLVIIIGGAGFFLGKNTASDSADDSLGSTQGTVYTNASDMRKDLNIKLAEHVALTSEALRVSYDDHESSAAVIDELDKNSQEIAEIIGKFYGEEPKATFLKMWRDQITFFVNYAISAKNDDKEGKEQALSDLEDYSKEAAEFLAGLNNNLSVDSLKPLFTDQRDMIIASINEYIEAKYPESFDEESKAYEQAGKIADAISDGIIKQFPNKFSE